MMVQNLKVA
jgi:hypothetical protein